MVYLSIQMSQFLFSFYPKILISLLCHKFVFDSNALCFNRHLCCLPVNESHVYQGLLIGCSHPIAEQGAQTTHYVTQHKYKLIHNFHNLHAFHATLFGQQHLANERNFWKAGCDSV